MNVNKTFLPLERDPPLFSPQLDTHPSPFRSVCPSRLPDRFLSSAWRRFFFYVHRRVGEIALRGSRDERPLQSEATN